MRAMTWNTELATIARTHLPAEHAATWTSLLRPAVRLVSRETDGAPVAARLGGNPGLPSDVPWPDWPGHGPLTFVASVDCASAAAAGELDIPFPADGTLLFFYFDGQLDDGDALVIYTEPDTQAGAAVLYIPADTPTEERAAPEGVEPYPVVELRGAQLATEPGWGHHRSRAAFAEDAPDDEATDDHPVLGDAFTKAVERATLGSETLHQIGGWAQPVQGPVEYEVAVTALGGGRPSAEDVAAEEPAWVLLAQVDSDDAAEMLWGDTGALYWLIRPEDLAARRFDQALFTWQCC